MRINAVSEIADMWKATIWHINLGSVLQFMRCPELIGSLLKCICYHETNIKENSVEFMTELKLKILFCCRIQVAHM